MQRYFEVFGAVVIVWLIVAVVAIAGGGITVERFGSIGDGFGPIGSILTAGALVFAFAEHRASAKTAHIDRLVDAYATWFELARRAFDEMRYKASLVGSYGRSAGDDGATVHEMRMKADDLINEVYAHHHEVVVASLRVQMLEDDEASSDRLQAVLSSLPSAPSALSAIHLGKEERAKSESRLVEWCAEVAQRRDSFLHLFLHTGARVRHGKRIALAPFTERDMPSEEDDG